MLASASTTRIIGKRVSTLLDAAPTSRIPCIRKAAEAALKIMEFSLTVKTNQEGLVAIGKASCCITAHIIGSSLRLTSQSDDAILRQDARVLRKAMVFILKCVKLPRWKRLFKCCGDEGTIQRCRGHLQEALRSLGLESNTELLALVAAPSGQGEEVSSPPLIAPPLHILPTSNASDPPKSLQPSQPSQYLAPLFTYTHTQGSVSTTITNSSCNVSGDKNNISFSSN